ncbi:unnamed protein product, partial [Mesorhabditis belari]|uniref:Uncharacterized protein n=1 Tax=Mesorhabditis belari TaxID=2138241 RepID=A0AAF3ENH0_9BILA
MDASPENDGDDMNISDDEMQTVDVPKKKPVKTGEYHWKKLTFSACDGNYRWFHYDQAENFFAQEQTQGKWYVRNMETGDFQEFDWEKNAAPEEPEKDKALATQRLLEKDEPVLYVKCITTI